VHQCFFGNHGVCSHFHITGAGPALNLLSCVSGPNDGAVQDTDRLDDHGCDSTDSTAGTTMLHVLDCATGGTHVHTNAGVHHVNIVNIAP
jgi:hypothetical protein